MDPTQLQQLIDALGARAWYAAAAILVALVLQLAKMVAPSVWEKVPTKWQWVMPVLVGMATSFTDAYKSGLPWLTAVLMTIVGGLMIGLGAIGVFRVVKESKGRSVLHLLAFLAISWGTTGCNLVSGPTPSSPCPGMFCEDVTLVNTLVISLCGRTKTVVESAKRELARKGVLKQ